MTVQVAVCGPRDCTDEERRLAYEVGRLLAVRDAVVICGGYSGVMAAVAAGARAAGGVVVGVLSGADREGANPDLTIVIPTGLGQARNSVIANAGDAMIVIGGSWGTLSEFAFAMRSGRKKVVQLGGWRVLGRNGRELPEVRHASTPEEAVLMAGLGR